MIAALVVSSFMFCAEALAPRPLFFRRDRNKPYIELEEGYRYTFDPPYEPPAYLEVFKLLADYSHSRHGHRNTAIIVGRNLAVEGILLGAGWNIMEPPFLPYTAGLVLHLPELGGNLDGVDRIVTDLRVWLRPEGYFIVPPLEFEDFMPNPAVDDIVYFVMRGFKKVDLQLKMEGREFTIWQKRNRGTPHIVAGASDEKVTYTEWTKGQQYYPQDFVPYSNYQQALATYLTPLVIELQVLSRRGHGRFSFVARGYATGLTALSHAQAAPIRRKRSLPPEEMRRQWELNLIDLEKWLTQLERFIHRNQSKIELIHENHPDLTEGHETFLRWIGTAREWTRRAA